MNILYLFIFKHLFSKIVMVHREDVHCRLYMTPKEFKFSMITCLYYAIYRTFTVMEMFVSALLVMVAINMCGSEPLKCG